MQRLTDLQMAEARGRDIGHSYAFCIHHRFPCSVNISADLILSTVWQMNFHLPHFVDGEAGNVQILCCFLLFWVENGIVVEDEFQPTSGPFLLCHPQCSAGTHRGAFPRETILTNTAHVCSVGATVAWLFLGTLFLCTPGGQDNNRTKKIHPSICW